MWHQYHQVRTSKTFRTKWTDFVQLSTKQPACPAFYQYVGDSVFKALVWKECPVESHTASTTTSITNEEANAIRYAAGYTLRALRRKIEASSHRMKEELVLAIMELVGDEDEHQEASAEWVNLTDRGGLWHVSNEAFMLFL